MSIQPLEPEITILSEDQIENVDKEAKEPNENHTKRAPKPTEKMISYKQTQAKEKGKLFEKAYQVFKSELVVIRNHLKEECTEEQLHSFLDVLETRQSKTISSYEELRSFSDVIEDFKPFQRRADTVVACTKDLMTLINYSLAELDEKQFDPLKRQAELRALKTSYAASVYSLKSKASSSHAQSIKGKLAEAEADLASKIIRAEALKQQENDLKELALLEEEKRKMEETIAKRKRVLELKEVEREVSESAAIVRVLNKAVDNETNFDNSIIEQQIDHPLLNPNTQHHDHKVQMLKDDHQLNPNAPSFILKKQTSSPSITPPNPQPYNEVDHETSIISAFAHVMDRGRLPVPTPKLFSGNPIEFVSFKRSFKTLIEKKGISAEEKIYYLQQYVSGEAKEAIAGCFYGTEEVDYQRAWQTLERRFGHTFKVQEAFREKLEKWPKINSKDCTAIQKYADFLRSCLDAMAHIKGLSVLNDCKENQKMATKLPEWMITRWSRVVTDHLDSTNEYPLFENFVTYVEKEARVACHPVASISAIKNLQVPVKSPREEKKSARTLATNVVNPLDESHDAKQSQKKKECPFCKEEHYLPNCNKFAAKPTEEKISFVKENKRCFGCLRTGHFSKDCQERHRCKQCKKRHPTVLHDEKPSQNQNQIYAIESAALCANEGNSNTTNVVPVWLSTKENPQAEKLVYALLDTQSDNTFIEENICSQLSAALEPIQIKLTTLLDKNTIVDSYKATGLRIRGYMSSRYIDLPHAYTRDFIPLDRKHIPSCETAKRWKHLEEISSEIPPILDIEVGLLIGYNCSEALIPRMVISGKQDEPFAVKTDLGWSIVGSLSLEDSPETKAVCHRISVKEMPYSTPRDALNMLSRDFNDTNNNNKMISQDDIHFIKTLENNITTNPKGQLEMPLPFKSKPVLPNNHTLALKGLLLLKRRFNKDQEYKVEYTKFIQRMIEDGDCELSREHGKAGETWFLPHHGVFHPRKKKLRVVFDCSAKFQGSSLNGILLQGPDLMNDLFGILCRFRRNQIGIACDIEKMFHRFHVKPQDRDYLRFLWWEDGDTNREPTQYRMNVHLFGATSSPGCANFAMKHLATSLSEKYPKASEFLSKNFYVDDGLTSVETPEEAQILIRESVNICAEKKIHLHKFVSNNIDVLRAIDEKERSSEIQNIDLHKNNLPTERTLGIQWNTQTDEFTFQIEVKDVPSTRRGILSMVASVYDPLGFISPFILTGKSILQEVCKRGSSWDDPIPTELKPKWESWKQDLCNLSLVKIPRCYRPATMPLLKVKVELHHFCDASQSGYGTCSYLRFVSEDNVHMSLVASKARVSPNKIVSMPRLELTSAVVATKLSVKVKEELQLKIDAEYFWCDSQVALAYINNEVSRFHMFVANRVQFIRENTTTDQWLYISTKQNPADHASRGLNIRKLVESNWLDGPKFLHDSSWKSPPKIETTLLVGDPEVKPHTIDSTVNCTTAAPHNQTSNYLLDILSKYSNFHFVCKVFAWIRRFITRSRKSGPITVLEQQEAQHIIIKLVQKAAFNQEMNIIVQGRQLPLNNKLKNLNPQVTNGILCVGGRLRKSPMPDNMKYPAILPKSCHFTKLIISFCHELVCHQGRGQTLNQIRSQGYWILSGNKAVAKFIESCTTCRKIDDR